MLNVKLNNLTLLFRRAVGQHISADNFSVTTHDNQPKR